MQYSDEEFYGNKQNTVTEQGEIKPIEEQNNEKKEKFSLSKVVLTTFLKTFIIVVCSVFYFLAVCHVFSPLTAVEVYEVFGANNAIVVCYENIYKKSGSLNDLYNLVQRTIEAGDSSKTNKYIEVLQRDSNYNTFCKKVNNSTIEVTEKKYIAYVADLDSYLVSQNILALYEKGEKQKAKELALSDFNSDNIYSFGFSTYADCLMNDNTLGLTERSERLVDLIESTYNQKTVFENIEDRLSLVSDYNQSTILSEKILKVYTALKIQNLKLNYYTQSGEESKADSVRLEIEELRDVYDDLIS